MERSLLLLILMIFLGAEISLAADHRDLKIRSEDKNPWSHLRFEEDPDVFRFAIVSDRSALPRKGVFSEAIAKLALLQPDFVMSVGDFVGGFTFQGRVTDVEALDREWSEIGAFVGSLEIPFFYVVGNNDISGQDMEPLWRKRFGRTYYSFVYRDVLFIALNSDDPPGRREGGIGEEQLSWLVDVIAEHVDVRWTMIFLHRPLWADIERSDWRRVEEILGDRPRTVFAGHLHAYDSDMVNGHGYYTLATTGGSSDLNGVAAGEFDHVVWVTMTRSGPKIANLMLDGIWGDDPPAESAGRARPGGDAVSIDP